MPAFLALLGPGGENPHSRFLGVKERIKWVFSAQIPGGREGRAPRSSAVLA